MQFPWFSSCLVLLDVLWISIMIGRFGADMSISGGRHTYERLLKPFPWQELETLKKALKEIEDLWKKGPYEAKDTD